MVALPRLLPGTCVLAHVPVAACAACEAACPHDAIRVEPAGAAVDPTRCTGCAACLWACPEAALDAPLAPFPEAEPLVLVCARHPEAKGRRVPVPCPQALGLRGLLALAGTGAEVVAIATADCATCPDCPDPEADFTADALPGLTALFDPRDLAAPVLRAALAPEARAAARLYPEATPERRALVQEPPLSGHPALALETLRAAQETAGPYAHAPQLDPALCTGCDACFRACPHGALIFEGETYRAEAALCTGCGICEDVCDPAAMTVARLTTAFAPLPLTPYTCRACGVPSHLPRPAPAQGLCPTCARTGHMKRLHQVLP